MPLENLSHFNQYKISEPKMPDKLEGNYDGKHHSCSKDDLKTKDKKCNWKQSNTITPSFGISDNMYDMSHISSEKSRVHRSEMFTSRSSDTHVLVHPENNGPSGMRDCSVKCGGVVQEKMAPSFLSQALT
jgi:hypothetical protein